MARTVEEIYGNALLDAAENEEEIRRLMQEAAEIRPLFMKTAPFGEFLASPDISGIEKRAAFRESFDGNVSPKMAGLLYAALEKGRAQEITGILDHFTASAKEKLGIGQAQITAPFPLSGAQKEEIRRKLSATTAYRELEIYYETDESLIGGLVIRVGDRVVDGSVKGRLKRLEKELNDIQLI